MRYLWMLFVPLGIVLAWPPNELNAGLIVVVRNATIVAGDSGWVDVEISSNANDNLASASFELRIDKLGATTTELRFSPSQSNSQLTDSTYLFAAGSLRRDGDIDLQIPPSEVGNVFTTNYTNDTFIGSDDAAPLIPTSFVSLTSVPRLLARLDLTPGTGLLAPIAGDMFQVTVVSGDFTSFLDENLDPVVFSATSGIITIAAVPEPGGLALMVLGAGGCARLFRRRQNDRTARFGTKQP